MDAEKLSDDAADFSMEGPEDLVKRTLALCCGNVVVYEKGDIPKEFHRMGNLFEEMKGIPLTIMEDGDGNGGAVPDFFTWKGCVVVRRSAVEAHHDEKSAMEWLLAAYVRGVGALTGKALEYQEAQRELELWLPDALAKLPAPVDFDGLNRPSEDCAWIDGLAKARSDGFAVAEAAAQACVAGANEGVAKGEDPLCSFVEAAATLSEALRSPRCSYPGIVSVGARVFVGGALEALKNAVDHVGEPCTRKVGEMDVLTTGVKVRLCGALSASRIAEAGRRELVDEFSQAPCFLAFAPFYLKQKVKAMGPGPK